MLLAIAAALAAPGCVGPQAIKRTRLKYNEVYHQTTDEQVLLNVVRLRYAEPPTFIELPNITSQFEASARGSYLGGIGNQYPGTASLGNGELFFRDSPTLSYQPRSGKEVYRALATPLTAELIRLVVGGASPERFLLMAVNDINDIPNAVRATDLAPRGPDDNVAFRQVVELFMAVSRRGGMELAIDTVEADTSDPIPVEALRGQNLFEAARHGYVFRAAGQGMVALKKRQKNLALRVRPQESRSPEMQEIARALKLAPGLDTYTLKSELYQEDDEHFDRSPNPLGNDTILLNMRSVLQVMTFLSKGVCVPPEHVAAGVAPTLRDPSGRPYDWTHVTAGLFSVRSSPDRPSGAEVAVRYKGYWFWIPESDAETKATLSLLELLMSLQESGGEELGPVLTLPVGG